MKAHGVFNTAQGLEKNGIAGASAVYYNLSEPQLYEYALSRGEAELAAGGALVARTGEHTGRSAKDKFVVRDGIVEDHVWWDNNKPMAPEAFDRLYADMLAHMKGRDYFVQDLYAGADPAHRLDVRDRRVVRGREQEGEVRRFELAHRALRVEV